MSVSMQLLGFLSPNQQTYRKDQVSPTPPLSSHCAALSVQSSECALQFFSWDSTSSVAKCPPLNWKVGCSIHGHWVNFRSTPCARVFTQNRPGRGQISGFALPPLTAVTNTSNERKKFFSFVLFTRSIVRGNLNIWLLAFQFSLHA